MTNRPYGIFRRRCEESSKSIYLCLDQLEGIRPRIEIGFGDKDKLSEIVREHENKIPESRFIMLLLCDRSKKDDIGFAKVYFSNDHEDITKPFLDYVNKIKDGILAYMRERNSLGDIKGLVSVHGSDDNAVLAMLKKYVRAEELIGYKI